MYTLYTLHTTLSQSFRDKFIGILIEFLIVPTHIIQNIHGIVRKDTFLVGLELFSWQTGRSSVGQERGEPPPHQFHRLVHPVRHTDEFKIVAQHLFGQRQRRGTRRFGLGTGQTTHHGHLCGAPLAEVVHLDAVSIQ